MYINVESLCCIPEANTIVCQLYSVKKRRSGSPFVRVRSVFIFCGRTTLTFEVFSSDLLSLRVSVLRPPLPAHEERENVQNVPDDDSLHPSALTALCALFACYPVWSSSQHVGGWQSHVMKEKLRHGRATQPRRHGAAFRSWLDCRPCGPPCSRLPRNFSNSIFLQKSAFGDARLAQTESV